ncbi:Major facilitator superfamily (MFS_1) transporter [Fulvimarina pelagi HTCC2506]|uniref:Major facilitator superfamily (MFS_1) transporter n=1 Tax=Fulvimarina pelagi HTCC2506 TaxID=314231 RepID=Q0FYH4_9HYPH|nr:MFS transporter [Fulvimarina pelagi]EAU40021.1 Major facilitator superfamily (MFS_1) transporter [Fulvimarina pelagi HTCC2506]
MSRIETVSGSARERWALVIVLCLVHLVSSIDRHVLTLVLEPVGKDLRLADTQLGFVQGTAYVALYAIAILPFGILLDRINRKLILLLCLILWSVGTAVCALAQSFEALVAGRMLIGLGQASVVPAAMSMIAGAFADRPFGRPVAAFTASATLGRGIALFGGGGLLIWLAGSETFQALDELEPWRRLLLLSLIANAIVLVAVVAFGLSDLPRMERVRELAISQVLLANWPRYVTYLGCAVATVMSIQVIAAWTPTVFVRTFAIAPAESGLLVGGLVLALGAVGNLSGGVALDSFSRNGKRAATPIVMIIALSGAMIMALMLCLADHIVIAAFAFGGATLCLGAATPLAIEAIQRLTPAKFRARVTAGFVLVVTLLSLGIGPVWVGWLSENAYPGPHSLNHAMLTVLTIAGMLGLTSAVTASLLGDVAERRPA